MEGKEPKKPRKIDRNTAIVIALAFSLGIGIGYLAGREGERAEIIIEDNCGTIDN